MKNNWYVITGGPSTGKTTVLAELQKLGHHTIPEAARVIIDEAVAEGISPETLRSDEKLFQEKVAKLKESVESSHSPSILTFFDRGMHDTLAYMTHYSYPIDSWIEDLLQNASYQKVFLLERLPNYEKDYARTEDAIFAKNIQDLLFDAYSSFGMKPILIPIASPAERAQMILKHTQTERSKL